MKEKAEKMLMKITNEWLCNEKRFPKVRILETSIKAFWISVSGCKLTILPDIQPANRIVIISGAKPKPTT